VNHIDLALIIMAVIIVTADVLVQGKRFSVVLPQDNRGVAAEDSSSAKPSNPDVRPWHLVLNGQAGIAHLLKC
jgi:hypothetical protein